MTTTPARPNFKLNSNPIAVGMTPSGNETDKFDPLMIDKLSGNPDEHYGTARGCGGVQ
jgi:hypothetical protein